MEDIIADDIESDFNEDSDITLQQILNALIRSDKNLELKTEIHKPKHLAALKVLAVYLEDHNYPKSAELINIFLETFFKYMVSYQRKSRSEIIEGFKASMESLKTSFSFSEKFFQNLKE